MMMLKVSQIFCSFSDDSFSLLRLGLASDCTPTPAAAPPNRQPSTGDCLTI